MKEILITNDDGFESEGLKALKEALSPLGRVTIVAPTMNKSACGHSLTLSRPLRFVEIDDDFFKLDNGTPSDCIYLALHALYKEDKKPDLIVSGINKGANMGEDITYSGTAAGAMEGAIHHIPSFSISQVCKDRCQNIEELGFELAKEVAYEIAKKILEGNFPLGERKFLNVNVPPVKKDECKGYKITKAGYRVYGNDAHLHRNPRGEEYYWLGLHPLRWIPKGDKMCDFEAVANGFVSITPIHLDMTSHSDIERLKEWIK
ncbi:MAG: 5'/3'-nucleotidase SurE [Epsilonproteobacteria bacterium]|nr:5'/3'-nucleotidase SurE [Campylobacterota bacterium]